jgi:hypothetical protein
MDDADWPPQGENSDQRLIFLAAQPQLLKLASPWWAWVNFFAYNARSGSYDPMRSTNRRLEKYVTACSAVGKRLSAEQLAQVRATGALPEDFLAQVRSEKRLNERAARKRGPWGA